MFKIGLDIGYGHTKIATEDGKRIVFPSLAKKGEQLNLDNMLGATEDYVSVINGDTWYIGKMAKKESRFATRAFEQADRYNDDAFKAMLATALALASKDTTEDILLVTGLPLSLYERSQVEFEDFLRYFTCNVEVENFTKDIKIKNAVVFPQAGGIFFSPFCLSTRNELPQNGNITVIDIGFRTTDCATFSQVNGNLQFLVERSFTIDTGMSSAFNSLARLIAQEIGVINIDLSEAEECFNTGICYKNNEPIHIADKIENIKTNITRELYESFISSNPSGSRVNTILLAGGGSIALKDTLSQLFPKAINVADTQLANALGFLNVAYRFDVLG